MTRIQSKIKVLSALIDASYHWDEYTWRLVGRQLFAFFGDVGYKCGDE